MKSQMLPYINIIREIFARMRKRRENEKGISKYMTHKRLISSSLYECRHGEI